MPHQPHGDTHGHEDDRSGHDDDRVTIFVNNRPVRLRDDHIKGRDIKAAAYVPAAFKLFDARGHEIGDDERIRVRDGDRFTAISGQDVS